MIEYILIGILAIVVWGLRSTVMGLYDRVYIIEKALSRFQVHKGNMKFKPFLDIEDEE